jgi:endonuclease/exonuclease/phosphatase family metal-dependent hydrolase
VFSALDPDIVCFQELYDNSAAATAALMETFLPSGAGEAWYARKNFDVIIVSRFPVLGTWNLNGPASDTNLAVLLDTQSVLGRTLLLVSAHMFCCTNNSGRQAEADRIVAFFADAKNPGGSITVPAGTAFMVTGDLNLVGFSQQLRTLLNGDIVDNATFGADTPPDWDGTSLGDVISSQTEKRFAYTWRSDTSSFAPGRLDFLIYNDSVLEPGNHFILYTPEMSVAQRTMYGLQAQDVTTVSDHIPHIGDFHSAIASDVGDHRDRGGDTWAVLRSAAPTADGHAQVRLDLERAALVDVEVFDARGARVATLRDEAAGELPPGQHRLDWNAGREVSSGVYVVRVVARSGDLAMATSTKLTLLR